MTGIGRVLAGGLLLASASAAPAAGVALAQIATDGTVGPARTLTGPHAVIGAELGTVKGGNLFHSFAAFGVPTGGSATFTGPAGLTNVLARVTGGSPSAIDGRIASTVPGAAVFLFNPAGIAFGPNASLDVPGAFHAAAAESLSFSDGGRFDARTPSASVLTSAPPAAFGFAGNPAALTSTGATLAVTAGNALSLGGGSVTVDGGTLAAPGGTLSLTATGAVTVKNKATVSTNGAGGGAVRIVGGALVVEGDGVVSADNTGTTDAAAGVTVTAGRVDVRSGGKITAHAGGAGKGGTVALTADRIVLFGDGRTINTVVAARSLRGATGDAGRVVIKAKTLEVRYGAQISTSSLERGNAGEIQVEADRTLLSHDNGEIGSGTGLFSLASATTGGAAGSITVAGAALEIQGGAQISARTGSSGRGGTVTVTVDRLSLVGLWHTDGSMISSISSGDGDAGSITITAGDVELRDGGRILSSTRGKGNGGTISITADRMVLDRGGDALAAGDIGITGVGSNATVTSTGHGGTIRIAVGQMEIKRGAMVTTSTASSGNAGTVSIDAGTLAIDGGGAGTFTGISSGSDSRAATGGAGGAITVRAGTVALSNRGAMAGTSVGGGDAGSISVDATDRFTSHGGTVATSTTRSDGGNIRITAGTLFHLSDGQVTTSVAGGAGNGGNISAGSAFVVLRDGTVSANAWGGNGGNIRITAGNLVATPDSRIEASSERGVSGTVSVQAPGSQVGGNLTPLKAEFVDAAALLRASCATREAGADSSTLTGTGRGGVAAMPDALLLAGSGAGVGAGAGARSLTVACKP
ncbi:MAG TPA: filamentous hemagglutinin N-terminal domain-containing protein [Azospirillum sp.]|nr:filamentous hemagglutinin N-terminal domain-containing protein [Azospirillum sp.]